MKSLGRSREASQSTGKCDHEVAHHCWPEELAILFCSPLHQGPTPTPKVSKDLTLSLFIQSPLTHQTVDRPWSHSWGLLGLLPSTPHPTPSPCSPSNSLLWISAPPFPETRPGKGEGNYFCSRLGFPPSATGILPNRKISFTKFDTYLHISHVLPFPPAPSHWPLNLPPPPPPLHSFPQRLSLPANMHINT